MTIDECSRKLAEAIHAALTRAIESDPSVQEALDDFESIGTRIVAIWTPLQIQGQKIAEEPAPAVNDEDFLRGLRIAPDITVSPGGSAMSVSFRVSDQLLLPWSPRYTISTARVAEMLDVSIQTVTRLIEDGTLKAYKVRNKPNSPWRINYDSVVAYIEAMHERNSLEKRF